MATGVRLRKIKDEENIPLLLSPEQAQKERKKATKAEWLAEGKALGASASSSCWAVGRWLVRGAEQFLPEVPKEKKAKRIYFANRRDIWEAFIREASKVTNLSDSTLKQYARVVRRGAIVEGLSFAHHLEVQRSHFFNEKGKRRFDNTAASEILNLAKKKGWNVAETRAEVQRRFPTSKIIEDTIIKAIRLLKDVFKNEEKDEQITMIDLLIAELGVMKNGIERSKLSALSFEEDQLETPY